MFENLIVTNYTNFFILNIFEKRTINLISDIFKKSIFDVDYCFTTEVFKNYNYV